MVEGRRIPRIGAADVEKVEKLSYLCLVVLCSPKGESGRRHEVPHPMKGFPITGGFFLWPKTGGEYPDWRSDTDEIGCAGHE